MLRVLTLLLVVATSVAAQPQAPASNVLLDAATSLLEGGQVEEAGRTYARVVEIDATNLTAHAGVILSAILSGDFGGARQALEAVARPPAPVNDRVRYGTILVQSASAALALAEGDTLQAFEIYKGGWGYPVPANVTPETMEAFMREWRHEAAIREAGPYTFQRDLSDALLVLASYAPTEDVLRHLAFRSRGERLDQTLHSLKSHPEMGSTAYTLLAQSRTYAQDYEAARVLLEEATRLYPDSYEVRERLGDVQGQTGRTREALATYRSLLESGADSTKVFAGLYRALATLGEDQEALAYLQQVPDQTWHGLTSGGSTMLLCNYEWEPAPEPPTAREVEDCATRSLWQNPRWGPTHYYVGRAHVLRRDLAKATRSFERAVEYAPDSLEYQVYLGAVLLEGGNVERAQDVVGALVERAPRFWKARLLMGRLLSGSAPAEAIPHLVVATELAPSDPEGHYLLGWTLAEEGRHERAVGPFTMVRTLAPDHPDGHFQLGRMYVILGRLDEAEAISRDLRDLDSEAADVLDGWVRQGRTLASPSSPLGEGWEYAAASESTEFWVRAEPVSVSGATRMTWTAATAIDGQARAFRALYADDLGTSKSPRLHHVLERGSYDCSLKRRQVAEAIYYDASGSVLESGTNQYPEWSYPAPGTVGEGLLNAVCASD